MHQISDEDKAMVSQESKDRARAIAQEVTHPLDTPPHQHPINTPSRHTHSMYPINTPYQHSLSTPSLNPASPSGFRCEVARDQDGQGRLRGLREVQGEDRHAGNAQIKDPTPPSPPHPSPSPILFLSHSRAVPSSQVQQIKDMLGEVVRRRSERVWLRNQHHGELDDGKIVDGLAGDRLVFKRRGVLDNSGGLRSASAGDAQGHEEARRTVQFVVDVSGSMMRFNGYDGRLERMLETTLMIMEALPRRFEDINSGRNSDSDAGNDNDTTNSELADLLEYSIAGHSGDTPCEVFVDFPSNAPPNYPSSGTGEKQEAEASNEKGFFGFLKRKKEGGAGTRSGVLNEKAKMESATAATTP